MTLKGLAEVRGQSGFPGSTDSIPLLVNLLAFSVCGWFAYARNINGLFFHFDGACVFIETRNQLLLAARLLSFANDYYQSIGNIQFLQNAELMPFLWPVVWFSDQELSRIAVFLMVAPIVFLAVYALARLFSLNPQVALTAGWIIGVAAAPFVPLGFFYPILWVTPGFVLVVATPVIAFWLLRSIGRSTVVHDVVAGIGLFVLALYLLSTSPSLVAIVGPGAAPYLVLAFVSARDHRERLRKLAALAALVAIAIGLEWPWFLLGMFSQTAPNVMPSDFTVVYNQAIYVSVLFHKSNLGWFGPVLVVMACLGAAISLRRGAGELRAAAWILLAVVAMLIALGLVSLLNLRWIIPPPLYFEVAIWPLYGVFAAIALHWIFTLAVAGLARLGPAFRGARGAAWMLPIAAVVITALLAASHTPTNMGYVFPPRSTPIVEVLRANIALTAQSSFNGRVATIIPIKPDDSEDPWLQQFAKSSAHARAVGNDEQSAGLWFFQIPTLFEYNAFMSPLYHALIKRALQRPQTVHQRNINVLTYPDLRIMALLGVRYLIMNEADAPPGERRAADGEAPNRWVLSELPPPNLATYAPTQLEVRADFATTLDFLMDERNDLARSAVVRRPLNGPWAPLQSSSLAMDGVDLHVKARSAGRSLVVVPLEFSRCIELRGPTASKAQLVRVDGLLSGLVFEQELDVLLAFRIGPLRNPSCRWRDYRELREMLPR